MIIPLPAGADEITIIRQAEAWNRQIARFSDFAQAFWTVAQPGRRVVWGWHLQYVCDRVQFYLERGYGTLVVCMPFRAGKSTLLNKLANAWDWLHRPWRQWINISKDDKNASRDSRGTRKIVMSEAYQRLARIAGVAQALVLERDQNEKVNFANAGGGGRRCTTTRGSITGGDGDVLVIDDPIDAKEVEIGTPAQVAKRLDEVADLYDNSWTDRMNPQPDLVDDVEPGVRIIIAQRTADGDLPGVLIKRRDEGTEAVEVIVIPEEFDPDVPGGVCPADPRKVPGELLLPELRGRGFIDAIRSRPGGERKVSTRLNQRPVARGNTKIKAIWFRETYDLAPHQMAAQCERVIATMDCAEEKGDGHDWTVIDVWGLLGAKKYLIAQHRERMEIQDQTRYLARFREAWPEVGEIVVENASNGKNLLKNKPTTGMIPYQPAGRSKEERAADFIIAAEAGEIVLPAGSKVVDPETRVMVAGWAYDAVLEWISFGPGASNDDRVDTAAMACSRFASGSDAAAPEFLEALARIGGAR